MDRICIYLRKSRADEEIEKTLGEGETLSKHRKALLKFAKEKKLNIVEIKEEIVSGDSLFNRPKMLELLTEIENKQYAGVLVMDIDRLGRGGMKDQGIILDAFKESDTKIITPVKTYDLNNELDEEMTEFKTFFSRRELKTITRRMQGGRVRSVEDGNYIATNPPLGYDINYIKKNRTLKINNDESEIVKLIFKLYVEGDGAGTIATYLNSLGYKTKFENSFSGSSIVSILKNPVYIGKITWKKKEYKKSTDPDKIMNCKTRDKNDWIISNGKHPSIIEETLFNQANLILNERYHVPYKVNGKLCNPLSGLIICGVCGNKMIMRTVKNKKRIMCIHKCGNKSLNFDYLENEILKTLKEYLSNYKITIKTENKNINTDIHSKQLLALNKELNALNNQKLKLFDLFERDVYTEDVFLERSKNIDERKTNIENELIRLNNMLEQENKRASEDDIRIFESMIHGYENTDDIVLKNKFFKSIIFKIEYFKNQGQRNDNFKIRLYPKLLR
ncbi:recombinase [Clostridium puniceum]|uniref:Recombinase n=1 Tax=Clostridium puniceum TaxID=29367 RepID=A0A1S8TVL7_9CLOT|nr:recombinase family protein [Clostridium puniceum]OOM81843.1 recombinase [Clostridium puniceum]